MSFADLLAVFGRFHPVVLHLPIGLLTGLALLEGLAWWRRDEKARGAIGVLVWVTAGAGVLAAVTGFVLGREEGYQTETVDTHRWLGIAVGVLCVVVAAVHQAGWSGGGAKRGVMWAYRGVLGLTLLVLLPTGHLGATATHGEGFLTEPLRARHERGGAGVAADAGATDPADTSEYAVVIRPFFKSSCFSCHGAEKQKGHLALNTVEAILDGSDGNPVIVPGKPEESELLIRLKLPVEDKDHMPPKGKPQPSAEAIAKIEAWIASGAVMTPARGGEAIAGADTPGPGAATEAKGPVIPAASEAALEALREALVHVAPVEPGSSLLVIDFAAVASSMSDEKAAALLKPVAEQAADVSLARLAVGEGVMTVAGAMPHLKRLDLRATPTTDALLTKLTDHKGLESLNLAQTKVTEKAEDTIASLVNLKQVYLWSSGMGAEAVKKLRADYPSLAVDAGDTPESAATEKETEVKFTRDAPAPGAAPAPTAAASLTPINKTCPVSGSPVDPRYMVVYEGKVIGFCCPNCPKTFWNDPQAYLAKLK